MDLEANAAYLKLFFQNLSGRSEKNNRNSVKMAGPPPLQDLNTSQQLKNKNKNIHLLLVKKYLREETT
jgi:hypothetical protein